MQQVRTNHYHNRREQSEINLLYQSSFQTVSLFIRQVCNDRWRLQPLSRGRRGRTTSFYLRWLGYIAIVERTVADMLDPRLLIQIGHVRSLNYLVRHQVICPRRVRSIGRSRQEEGK